MIVLLGDTRKKTFVETIKQLKWGRISTRDMPKPYEGERWGFDNGAFGAWRKKEPFPEEKFLKRLDRAYKIGTPYLSVTPDLVGKGSESLEFSLKWLDRLPSEWSWYLALQDGMTVKSVEAVIHNFKGLFLGGTNEFKATAPIWRKLSYEYNIPFHYGRAGTAKKVIHAFRYGATSLDSTGPLWSVEKFNQFIEIIKIEEERQLAKILTRPNIEQFIKNRIKGSSVFCPICHLDDIEILSNDWNDSGQILLDLLCSRCGKIWREIYSLSSVYNLIKK